MRRVSPDGISLLGSQHQGLFRSPEHQAPRGDPADIERFSGRGGGYWDRCGVVEAGMVLISYRYGRIDPAVDVSDYSYLIRILHDRFIKELGSFDCRVLRPFAYYLSGEAQNCSHVYKKGAAIVTKLLLEADQLIKEMPESERYHKKA